MSPEISSAIVFGLAKHSEREKYKAELVQKHKKSNIRPNGESKYRENSVLDLKLAEGNILRLFTESSNEYPYGSFGDVKQAIEQEKRLKGWSRKKKEALIAAVNPEWHDLTKEEA